jgi:predicted nucleotidyltransferase
MDGLETYRAGWKRRSEQQAAVAQERAARARALLPVLVDELVDRWGARRVVLIGSLARGELRIDSDIDLVAWGIPPGRVLYALAALDSLSGEFDVDLIPWERASGAMREEAMAGEVLHDT